MFNNFKKCFEEERPHMIMLTGKEQHTPETTLQLQSKMTEFTQPR